MRAGTNRRTETRAAPAPGNYRTAPTTGLQKVTATAPTWANSTGQYLGLISFDKTIYGRIVGSSSKLRCCTALKGAHPRYRVSAACGIPPRRQRDPAPGGAE